MGFSWTTFSLELVNFILFLWGLQRLFYAPLQRALDARRQQRQEAETQLAELQEAARALEQEQLQTRQRLTQEQARVLEQTRVEASRERAAIIERAAAESTDMRRREEERLAIDRRRAEQAAASSALGAATLAARNILAGLSSEAVDIALLGQLVSKLRQEEAPQGCERGRITSAHPLSAPLQERVLAELKAAVGSCDAFDFDIDEGLLAGLRLRLDNQVFDASLDAQLAEVTARAEQRLESGNFSR